MKKRGRELLGNLAKKVCSGAVAAVMALSLVGTPNITAKAVTTKSGLELNNPRIVKDSSYGAGQIVTYDCVYFGSYPQAEVVASVTDETTVDEHIRNGEDYVVNKALYKKLQSATGWDANGDITIDGEKYRRMRYEDSNGYVSDWEEAEQFRWKKDEDDKFVDCYYYFKYQPIKWRVLSVDGNTAFLMANIALDCQSYLTYCEDLLEDDLDGEYAALADDISGYRNDTEKCTWETSTMRSFLNSYGASANPEGIDYSKSGFMKVAFNDSEKRAIRNTTVVNDDNDSFGTDGGNNTIDRIFLLSEEEVRGEEAGSYGFDKYGGDEAKELKATTYAKAMGAWVRNLNSFPIENLGFCQKWLLRTPGESGNKVEYVKDNGDTYERGCHVNCSDEGYAYSEDAAVVPAMKIDLAMSNLLRDAGTVTTARVLESTKHNHNVVIDSEVESTCTATGLTQGSHCSECGKVFKEQKVTKPAHIESEWMVTKKATVKADGQKVVKCTKCNKILKTAKIARPKSVKWNKTIFGMEVKNVKDSSGRSIDRSNYTVSDTAYTVSDTGGWRPGKKTITVTFKGDYYSGKISKTYIIKPYKLCGMYFTSTSKGMMRVNVFANGNEDGYIVYRSTDGKRYSKVKTIYGKRWIFSFIDKSAKRNGKKYYYRAVAYVKVDGKVIKSEPYVKAAYFLTTPKKSKVVSKASRQIKVTYARNVKASGYEIRYSTKSSMKKAKTVTVKGNKNVSKTIKKLSAGKKYYVQVRSYKKVARGTYYSAWSAKKAVRVKR